MNNSSIPIFAAILALLAQTGTDAAESFSENFNNISLAPHLANAPGYVFGANATPAGSAQNVSLPVFRDYIATTSADYNTVDFLFEITVTVRGESATQGAFVGMGSALPDPNFFTEPHTSVYFRLFPDDFIDGALTFTVSAAAAQPPAQPPEIYLSTPPHPGEGRHRVRLQKTGKVLTMSCDVDYAGGAFVADYSISRRMDTDLAFLNDSNSRLFFGVQGSGTTFDDLTVIVYPSLTIEVADVAVCWQTRSNVMYQVEYRPTMATNEWLNLGTPVVGYGTNICILDPVRGSPRRFYRIVELP